MLKISNKVLFDLVRKKLDLPGLPAVKIGKAASGIGLPVCWVTTKDKGRAATREKILSFKTTVGSVGSVGSVGELTAAMSSGGEATVGNPSVTVGNHLSVRPQPTDADSSPTVPVCSEIVEAEGQPIEPTEPTVAADDNCDFYDPDVPDVVTDVPAPQEVNDDLPGAENIDNASTGKPRRCCTCRKWENIRGRWMWAGRCTVDGHEAAFNSVCGWGDEQ